tara:strand:+ start:36652 stop:37107 length:456 start_codon:yes stop_codon:yes gene_type:complete
MKHLMIYENFLTDYKDESIRLENKYKDKIDSAIYSILNKIQEHIIEEKVDRIIQDNRSEIYLNDEYFEMGGSVVSIYNKTDNEINTYWIFEKNESNRWYVIYDADQNDEHNDGHMPIDRIGLYRKVEYIESLVENFSSILNTNLFKKINKI